jgi:DNA mismatch endonuclease, patch repair protein
LRCVVWSAVPTRSQTSKLMDTLSVAERSIRMSRIRSTDTKPELRVRRLLHRLGYRYRLHRRDLPGAPDLVFPARSKVVFVHGCFWHAHQRCKIANKPKSRRAFWMAKFARNVARDRINQRLLRRSGWSVLVVWECETRDSDSLTARILNFLDATSGKRRSNLNSRRKE